MTSPNTLSRRDLLRLTAAGFAGASMSGWLERLADGAARDPQRTRSCILLWMNGGPATIDLWDLKPGHANGGPYRGIATSSSGLKIGEHLPKLAKWGQRLAVVRSMCSKEGDHGPAKSFLRPGQ